jgi:hypothetical protein
MRRFTSIMSTTAEQRDLLEASFAPTATPGLSDALKVPRKHKLSQTIFGSHPPFVLLDESLLLQEEPGNQSEGDENE